VERPPWVCRIDNRGWNRGRKANANKTIRRGKCSPLENEPDRSSDRAFFFMATEADSLTPGLGEAVDPLPLGYDFGPGPGERICYIGERGPRGFSQIALGLGRKKRSAPRPAPRDVVEPVRPVRPGRKRPVNTLGHGLDERLALLSGSSMKRIVFECAVQAVRDSLPKSQRGGRGLEAGIAIFARAAGEMLGEGAGRRRQAPVRRWVGDSHVVFP